MGRTIDFLRGRAVGAILALAFPLFVMAAAIVKEWDWLAVVVATGLALVASGAAYTFWPQLRQRITGKSRMAIIGAGLAAIIVVATLLASTLKEWSKRLTPEEVSIQVAKAVASQSAEILNLRAENERLRDEADAGRSARAERDSTRESQMALTAKVTILGREGKALIKRLCDSFFTPDSTLTADVVKWRKRVESLVRATSNRAFVSESYANHPDPRTETSCVGGYNSHEIWEIEQDLNALSQIKAGQ